MPEDWRPPGYDGEDEDDEEAGEISPDDPDFDLSEAHGYMWDPRRPDWPVPRSVLLAVSLLVIVALVLPGIFFLLRNL